MHELGIAQSALELALERARAEKASRVSGIVIRVGALSGVDRGALEFAFAAILPGTAAEGASVRIEPVPILLHCPKCGLDFAPPDELAFECPSCGNPASTIKQGRELDLVRLELN
jgi:hydrogenase nickel incorporation protein HypA/HybF